MLDPSEQKAPEGQTKQVALVAWPCDVEYLPALQLVGTDAPLKQNAPAGQERHAVLPSEGEYLPGGQMA